MDEHRSYLLRLWSGRPDHPWRARLECVDTGEVLVFRSTQELACFLAADCDTRCDTPCDTRCETDRGTCSGEP